MGSAVYAKPGLYTPTVTFTDNKANAIESKNTTYSVADAALTDTTVKSTRWTTEGKTTGNVMLATFSDANPSAPAGSFSAKVIWNGALIGSPAVAVSLVSRTATASNWKVTGSAVYADAGLYNLGITITDVDGSSVTTLNTSVSVAEAPLTDTTAASTINATRGIGVSNVVLAQFTDGNQFAQASEFSNLAVNWGGPVAGASFKLVFVSRSSTGSVWQVLGSATYTADGTYTVGVTIPDKNGPTLISKRTVFSVTG
jgi:hypothetical protein